ncbi:unnamed protein product [Moneuplotes crassus]|uniref:Uncharacterized protein n=1 Tax=Euplotes crassus TaxID=5936 RepID=A0AAD1Y7U7_EUPCR|nr:unnamed protein product [Moneuplotes crassus]
MITKNKKRSSKQCRERWHNHLDPKINKEPITLDEERKIFEYHLEIGNKWAKIANILGGRTDNMVKNHFYGTLRRHLRKLNKILTSKKFKSLCVSNPRPLIQDDLYKYIKCGIIDYDDLRCVCSRAVCSEQSVLVEKFRNEAIAQVRAEEQRVKSLSLRNRRSSRILKRDKRHEESDNDLAKIGFLVLVKILRDFRKRNKDNLFSLICLKTNTSIFPSRVSKFMRLIYIFCCKNRECTDRSITKSNEEFKQKQQNIHCGDKCNSTKKHNCTKAERSIHIAKKISENSLGKSISEEEESDLPETDTFGQNLVNDSTNRLKAGILQHKFGGVENLANDNFADLNDRQNRIGSEETLPIISQMQSNECLEISQTINCRETNDNHNKDFKVVGMDRNASRVLDTFGPISENGEELDSFELEIMNPSKLNDINFYHPKMNTKSSYVDHTASQINESTWPCNKQMSLPPKFFNSSMMPKMESGDTNIYDLNKLSGFLNISFARNQRIELEMVDDTHVQIKTILKDSSFVLADEGEASELMNPSKLKCEELFPSSPCSDPWLQNQMIDADSLTQYFDRPDMTDHGYPSNYLEIPSHAKPSAHPEEFSNF